LVLQVRRQPQRLVLVAMEETPYLTRSQQLVVVVVVLISQGNKVLLVGQGAVLLVQVLPQELVSLDKVLQVV
jgi:hypothetical protein